MKRIIEEVFQAEDKVGSILREARERASEIKRTAEKEASEAIDQAKQQAQEIARGILDEAREQASKLRQERLEAAEKAAGTMRLRHAADIDQIVEKVCTVVLTTDNE